jgi:hypothetical protein
MIDLNKIKKSIFSFDPEQWLFDDYDNETVISPLVHAENSRVVVFIVLMVGLIYTIPALLIIMYGHFMAKKNKDFGFIVESRKNIARFFYLLSLIVVLTIIGVVVVMLGEDIKNYIGNNSYLDINIEWGLLFLIPLIVPTIAVFLFLRHLIDISYFNIIKRHSTWVVNNGIFSTHNSDRKQVKLGETKSNTCNIADELQKLSDLKDKGVIDSEEFTKLKEKLLQDSD